MDLQTLLTYLNRVYDNPQRIFRLFFSSCTRKMLLSMLKEPSSYNFINFIKKIPLSIFEKHLLEIKNDSPFFSALRTKHFQVRKKPLSQPQGWAYLIYIIIRILKPKTVIETGVFDGLGTSFILNALERNKTGKLISIDYPAYKVILGSTDLMPFQTLPDHKKPGWLVPPKFLHRWDLQIINTEKGLGKVLNSRIRPDIFLHDSLHTENHMLWEMNLIWPKLNKGGVLLIDDIFCNNAFDGFKKQKKRKSVFKYGLGAIIK